MLTGLGRSPLDLSRQTCRNEMQSVPANSSAVIISGADSNDFAVMLLRTSSFFRDLAGGWESLSMRSSALADWSDAIL